MPYEWSEIGQIGPEMILVAVASTTPLMWVFSKARQPLGLPGAHVGRLQSLPRES